MTKATLDAEANARNGFTFPDEAYYCGSKKDYDYFVIRRALGSSLDWYRVAKAEMKFTNVFFTNRFSFTKDELQWEPYNLNAMLKKGRATSIIATNAVKK